MAGASKSPPKTHEIVRAMGAAFDPLVDVCLELGITYEQLASMLQAAFVHRAFENLPRISGTGKPTTANKVSVATGLHRNLVATIRKGGVAVERETLMVKERVYSKSARVLHGWMTDPRFLTSGGQPLDLPLESNKQKRGFVDLVDKYVSGHYARTILKELVRRGHVERLEENIIRFKTANAPTKGITPATVSKAAQRVNRLGLALFQGILDPEKPKRYEETTQVRLSTTHLARDRAALEKRVQNFLQRLEHEFGPQPGKEDEPAVTVGVGVFSWDTT